MTYYNMFLITVISLFTLIIAIISILSKKPLRTLIFNAFLGVVILSVIDLTSDYTNTYIPINAYTLIGSSVFGIPAIIGFLILKIIIL